VPYSIYATVAQRNVNVLNVNLPTSVTQYRNSLLTGWILKSANCLYAPVLKTDVYIQHRASQEKRHHVNTVRKKYYDQQVCSAPYVAVNMTLLASAANRRVAAGAPCSNRSILPACRAHSSKPAACRGCGAKWDRGTDGRPTVS